MSENTKTHASRREFLEEYRPCRGCIGAGGRDRSSRPCRGEQHDPGGLDRLRRRGTGAAANALTVKQGPVKLVAMADVFADELASSLKYLQQGVEEASWDRTSFGGLATASTYRPSTLRRFRRLPEGDGLPEAGRRGDFRHAAGVSLGAFRLCHREGAERLHGEAADGRRPDVPPHVQAGRRVGGEEPQGGRGIDVSPQPAHPRTASAHPGRRNRRHCSDARLPDDWAGWVPRSRNDGPARRANCSGRFSVSTASSGPAAGASTTSTSTSSTIVAG